MATQSSDIRCYKNCDERDPHSCFWYFSLAFPMRHLNIIEELTNQELAKINQPSTNKKEILKFFRILLLIPRLPDVPQKKMWRSEPSTPYGVAPDLGRTGMSKNRFERLISCIR